MNNINLVKIGSDSIIDRESRELKVDIIEKIINDILDLREKTGENFILLSSGAVAKGNSLVEHSDKYLKSTLASIGQPRIVGLYDRFLGEKNLVSQILIDDKYNEDLFRNTASANKITFDADFKKILKLVREESDKYLLDTIINGIKNNVLIIVNYNDSMSSVELDNLSNKTDNDKNTIYLTNLINNSSNEIFTKISKVFFLTNTDGVLDINNKTVPGYHFTDINDELYFRRTKKELLSHIKQINSNSGTGGMKSKILSSLECLKNGVQEVTISNSIDGLQNLDSSIYTKLSQ